MNNYYNVTLYFALTKEIWNCSTFYSYEFHCGIINLKVAVLSIYHPFGDDLHVESAISNATFL